MSRPNAEWQAGELDVGPGAADSVLLVARSLICRRDARDSD